jgi:hypothetical protein
MSPIKNLRCDKSGRVAYTESIVGESGLCPFSKIQKRGSVSIAACLPVPGIVERRSVDR